MRARLSLSPLNLSALVERANLGQLGNAKDAPDSGIVSPEVRAEEVTAWRCIDCHGLYAYEDEAEDCCAPDEPRGLHDQDPAIDCPVCAEPFSDYRYAADCCLWKDLDAPTRHRIADAVEAGSTWADELLILNPTN